MMEKCVPNLMETRCQSEGRPYTVMEKCLPKLDTEEKKTLLNIMINIYRDERLESK